MNGKQIFLMIIILIRIFKFIHFSCNKKVIILLDIAEIQKVNHYDIRIKKFGNKKKFPSVNIAKKI